MWFPRLAKLQDKLFWTQFLFGTKIKSTYKKVLPNTRILDLSVKEGSQHPILVLGPTQKWFNLPPLFFEQDLCPRSLRGFLASVKNYISELSKIFREFWIMYFFIYSIPFSKLSVHQRTEQRETGSFPVFSSAAQYSIIKGIELGEVTCNM